jgi:hypothetical protein
MKNNFQALALKKEALVILTLLIGAAIVAPVLFKQQLIAGTIVNATLILAVTCLGARDGLIISLVPSSFALATGLLPPVLAPMIPFIIAGNAILVLTFAYLSKFNFWAGVIIGSVLKFAFLFATSSIVVGLLINKQVASSVAQMMSWTQLFTAVAGGIVAFGIIKLVKGYQSKYSG